MDNKIIATLAGAAVVVIMLGALLVPIINDAIDDTKVYYNNSTGPFASVTDDDTISIEITTTIGTSGSTVYTVNGESVSVSNGPRAILVAENVTIYQNYSDGIAITGVDSDGAIIGYGTWENISITINGDMMTYTSSVNDINVTKEVVNEWAFYRYNVGNYRMLDYIAAPATVYVNDLNQVYGSNYINTTGEFFTFNGTDVKIYKTSDTVTSMRETTASVTTTDVMNNVQSFVVDPSREVSSSFKFVTDNNGTPYDVFPFYFIVPTEVYGQTESNIAVAGILTVLPLLIVVAVLGSFVYYRSRY